MLNNYKENQAKRNAKYQDRKAEIKAKREERLSSIQAKKNVTKIDKEPKKSNKRKIILAVIVLLVIIAVASSSNKKNTSSQTAASKSPSQSQQSSSTSTPATQPAAKVATRQVTGTATTLGAGTFTGGKDVQDGLYDVTTAAGQSGNFMVSGTDSYNEILGAADDQGVPKIRVQISDGDQIQISGLTTVTFTPVTSPFVTSHSLVNLYAGTWTVGQDIGPGRYVATPGSGQSGNFIVSGNDSYNEILGGSSEDGGVPSVTVNLTDGDIVDISSLSQVTMTPSN